jgi:hypothetical protein
MHQRYQNIFKYRFIAQLLGEDDIGLGNVDMGNMVF